MEGAVRAAYSGSVTGVFLSKRVDHGAGRGRRSLRPACFSTNTVVTVRRRKPTVGAGALQTLAELPGGSGTLTGEGALDATPLTLQSRLRPATTPPGPGAWPPRPAPRPPRSPGSRPATTAGRPTPGPAEPCTSGASWRSPPAARPTGGTPPSAGRGAGSVSQSKALKADPVARLDDAVGRVHWRSAPARCPGAARRAPPAPPRASSPGRERGVCWRVRTLVMPRPPSMKASRSSRWYRTIRPDGAVAGSVALAAPVWRGSRRTR